MKPFLKFIMLSIFLLFLLCSDGAVFSEDTSEEKELEKIEYVENEEPVNISAITPDVPSREVNSLGNTPGNLVNGSYVASQGEWIYLCNKLDNSSIYRVKAAGGEGWAQVCSDMASSINVCGDWIYFINHSDRMRIYRVRIDGRNKEKVSEVIAVEIAVYNGCIYYVNPEEDMSLCSISISDGKTQELGVYGCQTVSVFNDYIYYRDIFNDCRLYRIYTDGSRKQLVVDEPVKTYVPLSDCIYFISDRREGLYKIHADTKEETKVCSDRADFMNISQGLIYYGNETRQGALSRIALDGTGKTQLCDSSISFPHIIGNWIYFIDPQNYVNSNTIYKIRNNGTLKRPVN